MKPLFVKHVKTALQEVFDLKPWPTMKHFVKHFRFALQVLFLCLATSKNIAEHVFGKLRLWPKDQTLFVKHYRFALCFTRSFCPVVHVKTTGQTLLAVKAISTSISWAMFLQCDQSQLVSYICLHFTRPCLKLKK